MKNRIFAFDLDGTLCEERPTFEKGLATPINTIIDKVNLLYTQGHTIIIFTARGWQEYNMTVHWLQINKVKFTTLICGKPIYDYIIDDRAILPENIDTLNKYIKEE